jgi:hypothetical protein
LGFSDTVVGGGNLGSGSPSIRNSFQNVCPDMHSFCVPLTIYGFNDEEKSLKAASLGVSGSQCDGPFCVGLGQDSEVTSSVKGLLLSPNTVTHVGIIYCSNLRTDLYNLSPEVSNLQESCKLVIFTNDTTSPQVEIPCEDALHFCFEHQRLSYEEIKDKTKLVNSGSRRAEYVVRKMGLPPNVKVWISISCCLYLFLIHLLLSFFFSELKVRRPNFQGYSSVLYKMVCSSFTFN